MIKASDCIYYGGDYSPDQYTYETVLKDIESFKKAGINIVTLPVFSWTKLEPEEGIYTFEWLDKIVELFAEHDIKICMATPTAAQPAWLSEKYDEVLPVDIHGMKRTHGMRVFYCVNSNKYRERAAAIASKMAERYSKYDNIAMWHVSNEYGTYCYCNNCRRKFQDWLKDKYKSLENLNRVWNNSFWNKTYTDFSQIPVPSETNDEYRFNPTLALEYMRFMTDSTIECFNNEADQIRKYAPDVTIQTNISGNIENLNQRKLTKYSDIVSWDNYPKPSEDRAFTAMKHDLMRSLKDGESYMMQEQSPNQQNWQATSKLKRPGEIRMLSYQAISRGADACMFFQLRQSISGQEMYHGAVISHCNRTDTRIFKEVERLGQELNKLGKETLCAKTEAKAAIMFDWDCLWALERASVNCLPYKKFNYVKKIFSYYRVFHELNIAVDFVFKDSDIDKYDLLIIPYLYIINEEDANKIKSYCKSGKTLVGTYLTGLCDDQSKASYGAYPGLLRDVFGLWVEESEPLYDSECNSVLYKSNSSFKCSFMCDIFHSECAEEIGSYEQDFFKGSPAIAHNKYNDADIYYIGCAPDEEGMMYILKDILEERSIKPEYPIIKGVEISTRIKNGKKLIFILNWNETTVRIKLNDSKYLNLINNEIIDSEIILEKYDVGILKEIK